MTVAALAAPRLVSRLDVSLPAARGRWSRLAGGVRDGALALLVVYTIPLAMFAVLAPIVLVAWVISAISQWVF